MTSNPELPTAKIYVLARAAAPDARRIGAAVMILMGVLVATVRADEIMAGGQTYRRVQIAAYGDGKITFRTEIGNYQDLPIEKVQLIVVDTARGLSEFNRGEELLVRDRPAEAVDRYQRALRSAGDFWPQLVWARLLMAADRAADHDLAVRAFIHAAQSDPGGAAALLPRNLPLRQDRTVQSVRDEIKRAERDAAPGDSAKLIKLLKYEVLRSLDDPAWRSLTPEVAGLRIPPALMTNRTLDIKVGAIDAILAAKQYAQAVPLLDAAVADVPKDRLAQVLLLKARALFGAATNEEGYMDAAEAAMRVAIHFPDSPFCGDALVIAAQAHRQTGHRDDAARLLQEVLTKDNVPDTVKQEARRLLTDQDAS